MVDSGQVAHPKHIGEGSFYSIHQSFIGGDKAAILSDTEGYVQGVVNGAARIYRQAVSLVQ
jgi:hypothetical protein